MLGFPWQAASRFSLSVHEPCFNSSNSRSHLSTFGPVQGLPSDFNAWLAVKQHWQHWLAAPPSARTNVGRPQVSPSVARMALLMALVLRPLVWSVHTCTDMVGGD